MRTDVSLLDTTEHEKNTEEENKCNTIKARCTGSCAGVAERSGQRRWRLMALQRSRSVRACFSTIDGLL